MTWSTKRSLAAVVLAFCAAAPAGGQPLTLEDALGQAESRHPLVRAAAADLGVARGHLTQAGVIPANPVISGELARHSEPGDVVIDRGVTVAQEVEVGGQRGLRITAARHDVARAEHALADRRRTVLGEVRRAFAGLVAAGRRRALAAESAALAGRLAEATARRAGAGDIGELEVELAEIERTRATQALALSDSERARAAARLGAAIGIDFTESIAAQVDDAPPGLTLTEEALIARALATRPDLAAAKAERARLEAEAQLAHRRGWIPNPVFKGFYRQELGPEQVVGGEISVPFPVWNREQGTEGSLLAAASGAAAEAERLALDIPRQVHVAFVRRATATEAWSHYDREALPATRRARELLERGYEARYLGVPEVLVQQDRLLQVRSAAIALWLELREADADLIEAVGEDVH